MVSSRSAYVRALLNHFQKAEVQVKYLFNMGMKIFIE